MAKKITLTVDAKDVNLDQAGREYVEQLEKKVRALEAKVLRRDKQIADLKDGMDMSKEKRLEIKELSEQLCDALEWAGWVEVDY